MNDTPKPTFADLGIPFPLFEASADEASNYHGLATCTLCGHPDRHCFEMGIGSDIILPCPRCHTENALDADDRASVFCRNCESPVTFPDYDTPILICYQCWRAGNAAFTMDTELGMVTWDHAIQGVTHGAPGLSNPDFEMIKAPEQDAEPDAATVFTQDGPRGWAMTESSNAWTAARVPTEMLLELVRTPAYATWQGEQWSFHCKQPMVYIGPWEQADFDHHAADGDGRALYMQITDAPFEDLWDEGGEMSDLMYVYVHRCPSCGTLRAHWDSD